MPKRTIILNTKDRLNRVPSQYNASYSEWLLDTRILLDKPAQCLLRLNSARVPTSFYNVPDGLNVLALTVAGVLYNIVVPSGMYTATTLCNYLNGAMIGLGIADMQWSYNNVTGRTLLKDTGAPVRAFSISKPLVGWDVSDALGFMLDGTDNSVAGELLSTSPVYLSGAGSIFVQINLANSPQVFSSSAGGFEGLLAVIGNDRPFMSFVNYSPSVPLDLEVGPNLQNVRIRLTDEHGNVIPLPFGHECTFVLQLAY